MNKRMKSLGVVIILLLTLISFTPSAASTYWIKNLTSSNLYNNLQLAINDASPGDTLQIYAGSHSDSNKTIWVNKTITIRGNSTSSAKYSLGGNWTCLCIQNDSVNINNITIENCYIQFFECNNTVVDNVTLLNGSSYYSHDSTTYIDGIFYETNSYDISGTTIKNTNIFFNSSFGYTYLYAYPIDFSSPVESTTINNCYINCLSEITFDEFYIYFDDEMYNLSIANSVIYFTGDCFYVMGSNITIFNNTFSNVYAEDTSSCLSLEDCNNATIQNNTLIDFYVTIGVDSNCRDISIRNNTILNSTYAFKGQGSSTVSTGSEYVFNPASTSYVSVSSFNSTKFVVAFQNDSSSGDGTAVIGTISGSTITYGSGYLFNTKASNYASVSCLNSTHFVVCYQDYDNSQYGTAIIGKVSGSTITFGSEYVFNTAKTYNIAVSSLDSTHFVISYQDDGHSDYGTAIIGTVSGTTISYGSEYVFNSGTTKYTSVSSLDSNHFVVSYTDEGNSWYGTSIIGTVSGSTISYGSEYVFNSQTTTYPSVSSLDSSHFVVSYKDYDNSGKGTSVIGTISGSTISYSSEYFFNPVSTSYISVSSLDTTHFVVSYRDDGNSAKGTVVLGTISINSITYSSEYVFNSGTTYHTSVSSLDSSNFIVSYQDGGSSNHGTSVIGTVFHKLKNTIIVNNYFDVSYDVFYGSSSNSLFISPAITWNLTKKAGTNIVGGSYLGGNYWSCYLGKDTDGDGIGNTYIPYTGYGNEIGGDYLPLTIEKPIVYVQKDRDISWYDGTHLNSIWNGTLAVSENGTVNIFSGEYVENIIINKSITLSGNHSSVTIINATNTIDINASNVNITNIRFNFTSITSDFESDINISNCIFYKRGDILYFFMCYNVSTYNNTLFYDFIKIDSEAITFDIVLNSSIQKNHIYNFDYFVELFGSQNVTINKNTFDGNCGSIVITLDSVTDEDDYPTCYNIIMNNTIIADITEGIAISFAESADSVHPAVHHNHVFYNTISNAMVGLDLYGNNNTINSNYVRNNTFGIGIWNDNNLIFNNYISNTYENAADTGSNNRWNVTKTLGENIIGGPYFCGNYWNDYTGVDSDGDGIGETTYTIAGPR